MCWMPAKRPGWTYRGDIDHPGQGAVVSCRQVVMLVAANHSLLSIGARVAGYGLGVALMCTLFGMRRPSPTSGYARFQWKMARFLRLPLAVLGVVGLFIMMMAVV